MALVRQKYEYAVIAADVVALAIHQGRLHVLLMKMRKSPYLRSWAAPGGLVGGQESVEAAARRQLQEKTGLTGVYLEQLHTFGSVHRDPFGRVVSVAYLALLSDATLPAAVRTRPETRWWPISALPPLAYDHDEIIRIAVERLRAKLGYTNIVYGLLPEVFTLTELQRAYEIILGHALDKRNFRKKILSLGMIRTTGRKRSGEAHRPAALYAFVQRKPQRVSILET